MILIQGGDTGVAVAHASISGGHTSTAPAWMSALASSWRLAAFVWLKDPSKRQQKWLNGNIITHPRKPLSIDVSQSIVENKREASMFPYHSMVYRKWNSTSTVTGYIQELPAISKTGHPKILVSILASLKTMLSARKKHSVHYSSLKLFGMETEDLIKLWKSITSRQSNISMLRFRLRVS